MHAFGAGAADDSFRHILAVCQFESGAHAMLEFDDAGFAYEVTVEVLGADGDVLTGRAGAGRAPPQGLGRHVHRTRLVRLVRRGVPDPGPGLGGVDPRRQGDRPVDLGRPDRPSRRRGDHPSLWRPVESVAVEPLAKPGHLLTRQRPATRTRYDVVMRASSISIHRFSHASSAVDPSAEATETLPS